MTCGNAIQIVLDGLHLLICCMAMFRDRIKWKDFSLFPIFALLCGVARLSAAVGEDGFRLGFESEGFEILPANTIVGLLFLFLIVLVINSLWFRRENTFTLFGTIGIFAVIIILREALVVLFYLLGISSDFWFLYVCRALALPFGILFIYSYPFKWMKEGLTDGNFFARLLCCNTAVILVFLIQLFGFDLSKMLSKIQITAGALGIIIIADCLAILYEQKRQQERKRINMLEQYLPVIEELIVEIKARQHEHNNRLLSISAALSTADNIEQAKAEMEKILQREKADAGDLEIIKCDSKIVGGMLYSKMKQAQMKHIRVRAEITANVKSVLAKETDLAEIIGILMDNAIEAADRSDSIYVSIVMDGEYLSVLVSNPHEAFSAAEFVGMFRRGSTTKINPTYSSGHGLANMRRIAEHYHGKIITRNETLEDANYVTIGVLLP